VGGGEFRIVLNQLDLDWIELVGNLPIVRISNTSLLE